METKSRYEVIAELESKKRELIQERDSFKDALDEKKIELRNIERTKADNITVFDRKIEDMKDGIKKFEETIEERKETIRELIISMDVSLDRFGKLGEKK